VKVEALINPKKADLKLVLLLIEAESYESARKLIERFRSCPRVVMLMSLLGGYNIAALVFAEDMSVLNSVTSVCALRTSEGIRRSEVFLVSDLAKPTHLPVRVVGTKGELSCGFDCCKCPKYPDECIGCPLSECYRPPRGSLFSD
jgi:hypothetical protein